MTADVEMLIKLDKLKGRTEELKRESEGLLEAIEAVRMGQPSHLPILVAMLEDWALRLAEYLTWLVNLEDYLKS